VTAFIASSEAASAGAESTKQMQAKVYNRTPTPHPLCLSFAIARLWPDY
jgi:hypothetical protein